MRARLLVNCLSLLRIPLSIAFLLSFQPIYLLLNISIGICIAVFVTDILDGYVARRLKVASIHGRLWDSLGDKSFYIAVIIAFNTHNLLGELVCWGLLVREIALYITRIWYIEKLEKIEQIRPYTNWHGYFMYLTIGIGFFDMYYFVENTEYMLYFYNQIAAYTALFFGVASIFKFLSIK